MLAAQLRHDIYKQTRLTSSVGVSYNKLLAKLGNPALRHQPLIISRDPAETGGRGVVTTANYVARQLGIHSAMRSAEARRLAPDGIFLTPDFAKYKAISIATVIIP
ncbi:hypothetical protein GQS40_07505|uniref:UmuC domain-containing protein n=1 Tax=Leuconostoc lactis TaxID=1246 RepID=A0A6L7AB09_LEULA|nr:hypothetical protein [Leuconostoc lactis]